MNKEYLRSCHATQKFATLYDDGTLTPCEVLESRSLGNVRDFDFDFYKMKKAIALDRIYREEILDTKCNCEWMCAPPMNMLYHPPTWGRIVRQLFRSPPKTAPAVHVQAPLPAQGGGQPARAGEFD